MNIIYILPIFIFGIFSQIYAVNYLNLEQIVWVLEPFIGFYYELNNTSTSGSILDLIFSGEMHKDALANPAIYAASYIIVFLILYFATKNHDANVKMKTILLLLNVLLIDIIARIVYGNYAHDFIYLSINNFAYIPDIKDVNLFFVLIKYIKDDIDVYIRKNDHND